MPTASSILRLALQAYQENTNTWGHVWLNSVIERLEEAWRGTEIAVNAPYTLTPVNFAADEARSFVIIATGAGGFPVNTPSGVSKPYLVINNCADDITFGPNGGTQATVRAGTRVAVVMNAAGTVAYAFDPSLDEIKPAAADVDLDGNKLVNVAAPEDDDDAATKGYVDGLTVNDLTAPAAEFSMNDEKIVDVADPENPQDAATKNYIDVLAASSSLGIVAGIADEIVTVAGIAAAVVGVDAISDEVEIAAANVIPINVVADNIDAIIAATSLKPSLIRDARTSNTALNSDDKSKFIDITSGTFTQTFDAASSLGSGWWVYIRNSGTGDITLDPNSSEQIDGLSSFVMYPGEVRLVQCDGSALRSVVLVAFRKMFDASGTYVHPPGYPAGVMVDTLNGGTGGTSGVRGTGGGSSAGPGGAGGVAGTHRQSTTPARLTPGSSYTVTVGAGGAGGVAPTGTIAAASVAGTAGGTTSLQGVKVEEVMTVNPGAGNGGGGVDASDANASAGGAGLIGAVDALDILSTATGGTAGGGAGGSSTQAGEGGGGGGGARSIHGAGGNGGNGGAGAGGGGGGGKVASGGVSTKAGNGGNGGRGELRIWGIA